MAHICSVNNFIPLLVFPKNYTPDLSNLNDYLMIKLGTKDDDISHNYSPDEAFKVIINIHVDYKFVDRSELKYFKILLAGSLSITFWEKIKIIDALQDLDKKRFEMLTKILKEERLKWYNLYLSITCLKN